VSRQPGKTGLTRMGMGASGEIMWRHSVRTGVPSRVSEVAATNQKPLGNTMKSETVIKQEKVPKKIGRPSKYTPEIAAEICERLSNGEPLRQICRDDHMPAWQKIYEWMAKDAALGESGTDLSGAIARARDQGYDAIAEECLLIADTPQWGQKQVMSDQGTSTTVEDMLGHRKLQIETRLKLLAKWNPKKYGDRVALTGAADGSPIQVESRHVFDTVLKNLEATRQIEVNDD